MRDSATLFGGILLGALLSASFGLRLFPREAGPPGESALSTAGEGARTALELEEMRIALDSCRERLASLESLPPESPGGQPSERPPERLSGRPFERPVEAAAAPGTPGKEQGGGDAAPAPREPSSEALEEELNRALSAPAWSSAAALLEKLLGQGPSGHAALVKAVSGAARAGAPLLELRSQYLLLRIVAQKEREVAELISFALSSPEMGEASFASLVYRLAPAFIASLPDGGGEARPPLAQRLLAALEERPVGRSLWWVLEGLFTLGVDAGVESLARILADPAAAAHQGAVILHLGRLGSVEAARALEAFVERASDGRAPAVGVALRELALMAIPEAEKALGRFLIGGKAGVREAAHLAYFSRPRQVRDLPIAARFLDSEAPAAVKRRLRSALRDRSPAILEALGPNDR